MSPTLISRSVPGRPSRTASGSQAAETSRSGKVMPLTLGAAEKAANGTVIWHGEIKGKSQSISPVPRRHSLKTEILIPNGPWLLSHLYCLVLKVTGPSNRAKYVLQFDNRTAASRAGHRRHAQVT